MVKSAALAVANAAIATGTLHRHGASAAITEKVAKPPATAIPPE
jgi:hypothetical protein